jgi:hypothetical protein
MTDPGLASKWRESACGDQRPILMPDRAQLAALAPTQRLAIGSGCRRQWTLAARRVRWTPTTMKTSSYFVLPSLVGLLGACASPSSQPAASYPQYQGYPQGQYPSGQVGYPQGQYPQGQPPATTAAPPGQPTVGTQPSTLPAPPIGSVDGYGSMTPAFIRQEAKAVIDELIAALPDSSRGRVAGIPLVVIEDPKEVNAFAGCDKSGRAFMAITGPLLTIASSGSEAKAFDELNGTNKYDQYTSDVANRVRSNQPVAALGSGSLPAPQSLDARKLARQKFLFDEQVGFVLGHELAHHYRGHTGCANGVSTGVGAEDIGRVLSGAVPLFNQPMEVEADINGVNNVLDAGARRQGGSWTEEGAMMTLNFFGKLSSFGVETMVLGFMRTHPPPQLRIPIVQGTAQTWHRQHAGGSGGTTSPLPFPLPLPW